MKAEENKNEEKQVQEEVCNCEKENKTSFWKKKVVKILSYVSLVGLSATLGYVAGKKYGGKNNEETETPQPQEQRFNKHYNNRD